LNRLKNTALEEQNNPSLPFFLFLMLIGTTERTAKRAYLSFDIPSLARSQSQRI